MCEKETLSVDMMTEAAILTLTENGREESRNSKVNGLIGLRKVADEGDDDKAI